jgi:uncharacterized protein
MKRSEPTLNHVRAGRAPRFSALLLFSIAGSVAVSSCRKPPPDEVVYTGARTIPGGGATTTTGGGAPSPSAGSTGGGGPSGGEGGSGPGDSGLCAAVPAPEGPFSKAKLLSAIADCAQNRYCEFEARARAMRDKAAALAGDPSEDNAAAARSAWLAAMAVWQEAELFSFGPAARAPDPGAQDLRDQVYAWPLVSRCKIEEQIVSQAYAAPGFPSSLVNGRGLAALEYLVFYSGTDNACSQFSPINAGGTWAALGAGALAQRKAGYAAAAADDVLARAITLARAWSRDPGSFRSQLVLAGSGSQVFATDQDALNAVSDAMFYVERELKDWKLGRPLGLNDCFTPTCPEALESRFAQVSTAHLRANLAGFRRLFEGCGEGGAGFGFDDWLRAVGASELADRMLQALSGAQAAVDTLDPPIERALASEPMKVRAVYDAVKALTDPLKTELVTVLNLELPRTSEGDND